jgi:hypothetical protein
VYQWLAEFTGDPVYYGGAVTGMIRLQVMFRAFNPAAARSGGPQFQLTDYTVESIIRGYFVTASKMVLEGLVATYNAQRKSAYEGMLKEHDARSADAFIDKFETAVGAVGVQRGHVLLEPHAVDAAAPKLTVSGTVFPAQGDRSSKRLRMTVETSEGIAPIRLTLAEGDPLAEFRLLAGDLTVGSPAVHDLLAAFVNVLPNRIEIVDGTILPTLLDGADLMDIAGELGIKQHVLLPLWGERAVALINKRIKERRANVTSMAELRPVLVYLDDRGRELDPADELTSDYAAMRSAVLALVQDPILFVLGPFLCDFAGSGVRIGPAPDFRQSTVRGFDPGLLAQFGSDVDQDFRLWREGDDEGAYPHAFTDTPDNERPIGSAMNTLWNVLLNSEVGMTVRLSEWEQAQTAFEMVKALPMVDTDPSPQFAPLQAPWHAQVAVPNRERQFRLALMGNPQDDGALDKAEIDFDSPFKEVSSELK